MTVVNYRSDREMIQAEMNKCLCRLNQFGDNPKNIRNDITKPPDTKYSKYIQTTE